MAQLNRWIFVGVIAAFFVTVGGIAFAGTLPKTWSTSERLTASDLNANFAHVHTSLRGAGHTLITNADVSSSAAIAQTKIATNGLFPKAWGVLNPGCVAGTCSFASTIGGTNAVWSAAGNYTVNLSATRNTSYAVIVTPLLTGHPSVTCHVSTQTTSAFLVKCADEAEAPINSGFSFIVFDQ